MSESTPPPLPRFAAKPVPLWRESVEAHADVEEGVQRIGGWLAFFAISLLVSLLYCAFSLLLIGKMLLTPGVWERLTSPDSPVYHPLWSTVLIYESIGNASRILACIGLAILLFTRKKAFPPLVLTYLGLVVVFAWGDHLLSQQIPAIRERQLSNPGFGGYISLTIYALIWAPYFWVSERVRNTFIR